MTTSGFTHDDVQDLLGPLADGELPEALAGRTRAHLAHCARCTRALAVQEGIRRSVSAGPVAPAPAALHARVRAALDLEEQPPALAPRPRAAWLHRAAPWSGWALAAALLAVVVLQARPAAVASQGGEAATPPMVRSALADYRRVSSEVLPPACSEAVRPELPFPDAPLRALEARAVSCWRTTLQGEPVSAWAYRWGNRVVVAYVVPEALFFRQPDVRHAVARDGRYSVSQGGASVLAWPAQESGVLVVGDAPAAELESLRL
jgi:anti-sigma factor RsiW